ncbi:monooxygenase 3-like [Argentina anserina]|uniref:monooxygenase 3-like n=1 Tax=Argentina anserina TaxID=57926 RepID=UPI0021767515|nr:monooxygenase 3-like [Potentilla anserina]
MCSGDHERRVKRKFLLEALASELPSGTIRFSSKVVSIEESGYFKLVHLADVTILKAKVLVGCDGVNSVVAKWLGFKPPVFTRRSAIRGSAEFKSSHEFDPIMMQFTGNGRKNPAQLKQYMLTMLGKVPDEVRAVMENTVLDAFTSSPLRYRHPWEIL